MFVTTLTMLCSAKEIWHNLHIVTINVEFYVLHGKEVVALWIQKKKGCVVQICGHKLKID